MKLLKCFVVSEISPHFPITELTEKGIFSHVVFVLKPESCVLAAGVQYR